MTDPAEEAREAAARIGHLEARLTGGQVLRNFALSGVPGLFALMSRFQFLVLGSALLLLIGAGVLFAQLDAR